MAWHLILATQHWLLKLLLSWLSILLCGVIVACTTTLPKDLSRSFSPFDQPTSFLILIAALTLNRKSLPLYWHVRFLGSFFYESFCKSHSLPNGAVWQTTVRTGLYSPLGDCDILGHKSNSTYFADLDIARTQHFCRLMSYGIRSRQVIQMAAKATLQKSLGKQIDAASSDVPGGVVFALGGVATHFHREIKPYEEYDIQTRVLSWDDKWLYIISHFVGRETHTTPDIRASSIARVVIKKGRLSIRPDIALRVQGLLPPPGSLDTSKRPNCKASGWTADSMEAKRLQGLRLAMAFDTLGAKDMGGLMAQGTHDIETEVDKFAYARDF